MRPSPSHPLPPFARGVIETVVSGSGKVVVNAQETLDVSVVGSGSIDYLGNPKVQKRITGALDNVGQAASSVTALSTGMNTILNAQLGPDRVNIPAFVKNADAAVVSLREQQKRNLLATLFLSQGVPMLSGGDELGRT